MWQLIEAARGDSDDEPDVGQCSTRSPSGPTSSPRRYRWSYSRDIGLDAADRGRLACGPRAETRGAVDPRRRRDGVARRAAAGRVRPPAHRDLAAVPAVARACTTSRPGTRRWPPAPGARRWSRLGERIRQEVDLEHWAAFQDGLHRGRGAGHRGRRAAKRGTAPGTVTFLSGDVHNSYVAEVDWRYESRIVQAVCSPIRNPLPYAVRYMTGFSSKNIGRGVGGVLGSAGEGAARAVRLADDSWAVVRQQPRDVGDGRSQLGHAMGPGRGVRRQGRRPGARTGVRRGDPQLQPALTGPASTAWQRLPARRRPGASAPGLWWPRGEEAPVDEGVRFTDATDPAGCRPRGGDLLMNSRRLIRDRGEPRPTLPTR